MMFNGPFCPITFIPVILQASAVLAVFYAVHPSAWPLTGPAQTSLAFFAGKANYFGYFYSVCFLNFYPIVRLSPGQVL